MFDDLIRSWHTPPLAPPLPVARKIMKLYQFKRSKIRMAGKPEVKIKSGVECPECNPLCPIDSDGQSGRITQSLARLASQSRGSLSPRLTFPLIVSPSTLPV